jgi:hypothetical protein
VREVERVLVKGGVVVIYTPQNRLTFDPIWPWHFKEFSYSELKELVSERLVVTNLLGWQHGTINENDPRGDGTYVIARKGD